MDLNGLIGELPLLFNSSDALKSSGETYKYLPVLELIRLKSSQSHITQPLRLLRSDLRLFIQLYWAVYRTPKAGFEPATSRLTVGGSAAELLGNDNNRCSSAAVAPRGIPPLSHMGWFSDSFFSRRCEHGCRQSVYGE